MHSFLENLAEVARIVTFQPGRSERMRDGARWTGNCHPPQEAEWTPRRDAHVEPRSPR